MVVFFHGGGKSVSVLIAVFETSVLIGWSMGSRKTHQTIVNMIAEYLPVHSSNTR